MEHEHQQHPAVSSKQLERGRIALRVCPSSLSWNANSSGSTSKKQLINFPKTQKPWVVSDGRAEVFRYLFQMYDVTGKKI
jgi:hypothetical protein